VGGISLYFILSCLKTKESDLLKLEKITPSTLKHSVDTTVNLDPFTNLLQSKRVPDQDLFMICKFIEVLVERGQSKVVPEIKELGVIETVWEWYDDMWYEYSPVITAEIEKARMNNEHEFNLEWKEGMPTIYQGSGYIINLIQLKQINIHTGFGRDIRSVKKIKDFPRLALYCSLYTAYIILGHLLNIITNKILFETPSLPPSHLHSLPKNVAIQKSVLKSSKPNQPGEKDKSGVEGAEMTEVMRKMINWRIKLDGMIEKFGEMSVTMSNNKEKGFLSFIKQ